MRRGPASSLWTSKSGAAAAEMALVTPLLITLMFGAFELGNYFLSEHVVVKAVRDGARYAARRSFTDYTCSAASSDVIDKVRNLTRTGTIASGGTARLVGWTSGTTITVSVACDTSGSYSGVYKDMTTGVPVVTVSASVPYSSLFKNLGFSSTSIALNAKSQSAVMGL